MSGSRGSLTCVSAAPAMIRARGLVKRFGSFTAVDGIDFDLSRGEAFGFLGPNGAGKSSTMRMIGCVSPPSAGELSILGLDPVADGPAIRARLGVVPQEDTLDVELTVQENLLVYGRYFGDRKSTRLNSSHDQISYAVFCLKKKKKKCDMNVRRFYSET